MHEFLGLQNPRKPADSNNAQIHCSAGENCQRIGQMTFSPSTDLESSGNKSPESLLLIVGGTRREPQIPSLEFLQI